MQVKKNPQLFLGKQELLFLSPGSEFLHACKTMRVPHVSRDQYMSQHSEAEQSNDRTYKARETSMCVCGFVCVWNRQVGGGLGPDEVLAGVTTQVLPCFNGHHFTHKYPGYQRQC